MRSGRVDFTVRLGSLETVPYVELVYRLDDSILNPVIVVEHGMEKVAHFVISIMVINDEM